MADDNRQTELHFDQWYRHEHPRVYTALAVAGGDVEIAREATDEAFVRAYERWARVRVMESPGGWLYRVALNELRRRHRRQALEREILRRQPPQPADGPPPVADPEVWDAVRGLPRRQRSAIALRYVLDLTERDVAATMGISRGAASATLTSARKHLQQALGNEPSGASGSEAESEPEPESEPADDLAPSIDVAALDG